MNTLKNFINHSLKKITSKNHRVFTQDNLRKSLSSLGDKKYIKGNRIDTHAYGSIFIS